MSPVAYVEPVYGLANRLRGLTSAWAIARKFRLRLKMLWAPGQGFSDDTFEELFDNQVERVDRARFDQALADGVPDANAWLEGPPADLPRRIKRNGFIYATAYRNLDGMLHVRGATLRGCRKRRHRCCRELRPAKPIAQEVDAFVRDRFAGRPILGVHIRRGDALKGPKREHYLPSTDEAFEKVMRAWDGAFFLATDCEETESRFREMFGDRILTRGKPWVPSEFGVVKEGQRDAVADLFLLSRTRRVIGTRHSSFGHVAALMGGVDYQVAL